MCDNTKVTQYAQIGAHDNTFVGCQNNYGLSIAEATQMAFQIFQQYYPQLRQDAINELEEILKNELKKIEPQNIVPPMPRIVVPTLQGASIADEKSIRELYAKLLAGAMNAEKKENVHPAYVKIIDEMNAMDAKVLKVICEINDSIPLARIKFVFDGQYLTHAMPHFYSVYFKGVGDVYEVSRSIENLSRLNLINLFEGTVNGYDYKQLETEPYVQEKFAAVKKNNPETNFKITIDEYVIQENDFGRQFSRLCMTD